MEIYLSLGSNLGDRAGNIHEALQKLNDAFGMGYSKLSKIMETPSWGFEGNDFLNCAVLYLIPDCGMNPELHSLSILRICKSIESEMGRDIKLEFDRSGQRIYKNRIIDIDILFYGTFSIHTPSLTIPHPLIPERDFVLRPLGEIVSNKILNIFGNILHNIC